MKAFISGLIAFCLIGCASDYDLQLSRAIHIRDALNRYGVWAEVLKYERKNFSTNTETPHVVVIFKYPENSNTIRSYDQLGSYSLFDYHGVDRINYPLELAQESEVARQIKPVIVTKAEFVQ